MSIALCSVCPYPLEHWASP